LTLDVETQLSGPVFNTAGGLFTHPNLVFGKWTLGGLVQNEWIWGLELTDAQTWLSVSPNAGTLDPESTEDLVIGFDAADLGPGEYQAEILFTSWPEVGNPLIEVTLLVTEISYYPCDLDHSVNCTDVELTWDVCPAGSPDADSFYVYRDDVLLGVAYGMDYNDNLVDPEVPYLYHVIAYFGGLESIPSADLTVIVPTPPGLEPTNLQANVSGNAIELTCDPPSGCLLPDSYNLYLDGALLENNLQGNFTVDWSNGEYYVTAVYYFGESLPSNSVLITGMNEKDAASLRIFPNPVSEQLFISAPFRITSLQLMDTHGAILLEQADAQGILHLDLQNLSPGIYLLEVVAEGQAVIRKVIKR
jgi:hypothetical protein